jgi:hypothetical protein
VKRGPKLQGKSVSAKETSGAGTSKVNIDKIKYTAIIPQKGGETTAGHALQKHAGRNPDIWGKVKGNAEQINKTAMQHLDEILNASGDFKEIKGSNGEFRIDF